jgi:NAD(P)-dependent dehydrogenase (short-subunit alcohol dehydrogenase family)
VVLRNRTALVTGGTHGIGRAIVKRFLAEGARVVTIGRVTMDELPPRATLIPFDYDVAPDA